MAKSTDGFRGQVSTKDVNQTTMSVGKDQSGLRQQAFASCESAASTVAPQIENRVEQVSGGAASGRGDGPVDIGTDGDVEHLAALEALIAHVDQMAADLDPLLDIADELHPAYDASRVEEVRAIERRVNAMDRRLMEFVVTTPAAIARKLLYMRKRSERCPFDEEDAWLLVLSIQPAGTAPAAAWAVPVEPEVVYEPPVPTYQDMVHLMQSRLHQFKAAAQTVYPHVGVWHMVVPPADAVASGEGYLWGLAKAG